MASKAASAAFFTPLKLGPYTLQNRLVLAPLTRCRATPAGMPTPLMEQMYGARGDAGLLVTEATLVSEAGRGVPNTPGVYSDEQARAWAPIVKAVHAKGGRLFCQLWHTGRAGSKALTPGNVLPVAPSAMPWSNGYGGVGDIPRALETSEIAGVVAEYRHAAQTALDAGFDGVELHAANGYLPNQFLADGSNTRTDAYGGSIANRCRFTVEVMRALIEVWGPERVGIRLSPSSHWQDITDSDPVALYKHLTAELVALGPLAYLHVVEPREDGASTAAEASVDAQFTAPFFRAAGFTGPLLSAGGHNFASGVATLEAGRADAVVYGRHYIANPDLVTRFRLGPDTPLNPYDRSTFYANDAKGYTDYPTLEELEAKAKAATA